MSPSNILIVCTHWFNLFYLNNFLLFFQETKAASVDILLYIVDYSPSLVREYMMHQTLEVKIFSLDDQYILSHFIQILIDFTSGVGPPSNNWHSFPPSMNTPHILWRGKEKQVNFCRGESNSIEMVSICGPTTHLDVI